MFTQAEMETFTQRRFQRMNSMSTLGSVLATATGGRNGHTEGADDSAVRVEDKRLGQADLVTRAREAHEQGCPYSRAARGSVVGG